MILIFRTKFTPCFWPCDAIDQAGCSSRKQFDGGQQHLQELCSSFGPMAHRIEEVGPIGGSSEFHHGAEIQRLLNISSNSSSGLGLVNQMGLDAKEE